MAVSKVMTTLAQDAYDANQYRGVIGASKESREAAKRESAEASTKIIELIQAVQAGGGRLDFDDVAAKRLADALAAVTA